MRWRIIVNPAAGRGRGAAAEARLEALLAKHAPPAASWWITVAKAHDDVAKLARAARDAGFDGVAAAGGDGTLGEVLNGLVGDGQPCSCKLALLPLGTGNDFARCIGLGANFEAGVLAMLQGAPKRIDAGLLRNSGHQRYFLNVAGCGFDAEVAVRINRRLQNLRGRPAYLAAVLRTLHKFKATRVKLTADGRTIESRAMLCAVANATSYGGGMMIAPRARLDDGHFDICLVGDASRLEFLAAFPRVFTGKHEAHRKVTTLRAKQVRLVSDPPLPVLADGEIIGMTPVEFEAVPGVIEVMMPIGKLG